MFIFLLIKIKYISEIYIFDKGKIKFFLLDLDINIVLCLLGVINLYLKLDYEWIKWLIYLCKFLIRNIFRKLY